MHPSLCPYCLLVQQVLTQPLLLPKVVTGWCVNEVTGITQSHSTDQTFHAALIEMSPWGLAGCCLCSVRLRDGKASQQLLIPTHHTRHFLSPPVTLMQLEFHKSNLSSKKVNKFTLYI